MKYDAKYPEAGPNFESPQGAEIDPMLFFPGSPEPCGACSEGTNWVSLSFECPICSEECLKVIWDDFVAAFNRHEHQGSLDEVVDF